MRLKLRIALLKGNEKEKRKETNSLTMRKQGRKNGRHEKKGGGRVYRGARRK